MSGHNKWSKIKHKKAAEDSKKGKVFSSLSQAIAIESRRAEGNLNDPGLKAAIDRARAVNMPSANIDRAVAKGVGSNGADLTEIVYEGYGPGGVALIIKGLTDNTNRTTPEIRHLLNNAGGSLGEPGSTSWAFNKNDDGWAPVAEIPLSDSDKNKLNNLIENLEEHPDIEEIVHNAS